MSQQDVPFELRSHGGESPEEIKRLKKSREKFRRRGRGQRIQEDAQMDSWLRDFSYRCTR